MDFMEAVEEMKRGKKVRRSHWENIKEYVLKNDEGSVITFTNDIFSDRLTIFDLESKDWELFEETKTLSEIENTLIEKLDKDTTEIYHGIKLIELKDGRQAHLRVVLTTEL